MRKTLLFFVVALFSTTVALAQDNVKSVSKSLMTYEEGTNALGLRLGNNWGELSYQKFVSKAGRMEIDLGFDWGDAFNLSAIYQRVQSLDGTGAFNWYYGLGASAGVVVNKLHIAAVGQIGVEYRFKNTPISLSLDWKPRLNLIPSVDFGTNDFALGIRYRF